MSQISAHFGRQNLPPDRRAHARQPVRSLAYVELGEGNGGIALNVSEGGIAVQAVMSLDDDESPEIRIQLAHSKRKIEAKGRIAWTGDLRKIAGLKFVDLSQESRMQIREWISLEDPVPQQTKTATSERLPGLPVKRNRSESPASVSASPDRPDANAAIVPSPAIPNFSELPPIPNRPRAPVLPASAVPPAFVPRPYQTIAAPSGVRSSAPASPAKTDVPSVEKASNLGSSVGERKDEHPRVEVVAVPQRPAISLGPPPELAALPADRFGFRQSRATTDRESGKWSLVVWVTVFTLISLGAGWVAGHGEWRTVVQRIGGRLSPASTTTQHETQLAPPPDLSDIEVVDRNNRRWMIPMAPPAPNTPAALNRTDSQAPPRRNASTIPNSNLPSPVPSRPSVDEIKPMPPVLAVAPAGPENVLPLGDSADAQRAVPAPTPRVPSGINSSDLQPGELTHKVDPEYPPAALTQKVEGTVKILVVIGLDGNVKTVQPLSGPPMLIPAALNAVRQWRYSPTLLHGKPIETQREISVAFRIASSQ